MEAIKRVIILLLVAVGVFATVECISYMDNAATNWGVNPTVVASKDTPVNHTAAAKTSNVQVNRKSKAPAT